MLAQTGVADRATWLAIAPYIDYGDVYLRRGDRGMLVTILQTALTSAGFSPGQADGIFGSRTFNAVTAFQRANRITADGIAGPRTWALLKPYLSGELMTYVVRRGDTLSSIARRSTQRLKNCCGLTRARIRILYSLGKPCLYR